MDIGSRIKEQRALLGISQQKLANEIGVSVDTIRSLEINRANPSIDTISKLSDVFRCTTDYLLGKESDRQSVLWDMMPPNEVIRFLNEILEHASDEEYRKNLIHMIETIKKDKNIE